MRKRYEEMYRQGKNAGSMEASIDARGSANITISANLQIGKSTAPETEEINICYVSRNDIVAVCIERIVVINMIRRKFDNVASLIHCPIYHEYCRSNTSLSAMLDNNRATRCRFDKYVVYKFKFACRFDRVSNGK